MRQVSIVRWWILSSLVISCGLGGAARAAPAPVPPPPAPTPADSGARQHRTVEIQAIDRRVTQPAPPAAAVNRAPGPAVPIVTLEAFLSQRRARLKQITDAQIAKMRSLVAGSAEDDPLKPDFYFRLGELQADNRRFYSDQARALDQKIFEARGAGKAPLEREQQTLEQQAQTWLLEAVKSYLAASRYPRYERMDQVLFRLAYLLTAVKKEDQAREFLLRLIKDHPGSRFVPDAYLSFAELYFARGEIDSALRFYEKVEQFPTAGVYAYAVYKEGWCHLNLGDFKRALETFVRIARLSPARRDLEPLIKEARKDIVVAYAHVGGPDRAWDFFRRTGGESADRMMEALAERYWEQGQGADSTRAYRKIMAENPASPRLCEWQGKVLRNALSLNDKRDQVQELERLGAVYQARHQSSASAQRGGRADECRSGFHDAAREIALVWHREAQKTRNTDTYGLAERAYRLFLGQFPADPDAYEMSYYHGELLWTLGRWKDAAELYTRVVEIDPNGKYLRDAAHAAVLAWKNALAVDDDQQRARPERQSVSPRGGQEQGRMAPRPIPAGEQKLIAALQTFQKHVPDAPELPAIIYREAYINYDYNHFDRAEALFQRVFDSYPEHQLAPIAADLYLDALNAQGKTKEIGVWVQAFLERPAMMKDRDFVGRMESLFSDVLEREAGEHRQRGEYKECGQSLVASAEIKPDHPRHGPRLWNAGHCFRQAHLIGQAVKYWLALIHDHPDQVLAQRAVFQVGAGYHQLAYYEEAAARYEEFARRFAGEPQAIAALGDATMFREGLGQGKQAIADLRAFVDYYGAREPAQAAAVYFQMGEVYQGEGRRDELAAHLRSYLEKWARPGGVDRQVRAHFLLGELAWKASCARPDANGSCLVVQRVTSTRGDQLLSAARRKLGKERRTQCGPATKSSILTLPRDRAQARTAEDHFRQAVALWKASDAASAITGREREARLAAAAHAAAGAAFYLAETSYEDLLRVKFPQNLDFTRPSPGDSARRQSAVRKKLDDSNRRFAAYMAEKTGLLEKVRGLYLEVFNQRQAYWTIAAAARIGQLHQDFAGQLYTAEIPRDLPESDQWGNRPRDLYCDELEDRAGKIEAQAIEGFTACLAAATRQSWYSEWSRLCERELNQLEPARFPLAAEIKPEPVQVPTTISPAPLIRELN